MSSCPSATVKVAWSRLRKPEVVQGAPCGNERPAGTSGQMREFCYNKLDFSLGRGRLSRARVGMKEKNLPIFLKNLLLPGRESPGGGDFLRFCGWKFSLGKERGSLLWGEKGSRILQLRVRSDILRMLIYLQQHGQGIALVCCMGEHGREAVLLGHHEGSLCFRAAVAEADSAFDFRSGQQGPSSARRR